MLAVLETLGSYTPLIIVIDVYVFSTLAPKKSILAQPSVVVFELKRRVTSSHRLS